MTISHLFIDIFPLAKDELVYFEQSENFNLSHYIVDLIKIYKHVKTLTFRDNFCIDSTHRLNSWIVKHNKFEVWEKNEYINKQT